LPQGQGQKFLVYLHDCSPKTQRHPLRPPPKAQPPAPSSAAPAKDKENAAKEPSEDKGLGVGEKKCKHLHL